VQPSDCPRKLQNWKVKRVGHATVGLEGSGMNRDLRDSLSDCRLSISLQYVPRKMSLNS
jgi:hypothetical protein